MIGQESIWAAEAALCAGDQNKFWEYHDKLFAGWKGENKGTFAVDKLKDFAATLGLNQAQFNSCLESGKYEKQVKDETAESQQRGVTATPTFFVNNAKVEGARPFQVFRAAIETELQKVNK